MLGTNNSQGVKCISFKFLRISLTRHVTNYLLCIHDEAIRFLVNCRGIMFLNPQKNSNNAVTYFLEILILPPKRFLRTFSMF